MDYCPLISYQKRYEEKRECMEEDCTLYSHDKGACLIRCALLKYTQDMTAVEERIKELESEIKYASMGFLPRV